MKVHTKIQKWGNSLGLRISGPMKSIPGFLADMPVEVEVSETGLKVTAMKATNKVLPFSEKQLLSGLSAETVADDLVAKPLDDEWSE